MYYNYSYLYASYLHSFGGFYSDDSGAGAFYLRGTYISANSSAFLGGRLMVL